MPYIKQNIRANLSPHSMSVPLNAGELNYQLTKLVNRYISAAGLSYGTLNNAVGALECAKLELYRRVILPYEDEKINENGDVY